MNQREIELDLSPGISSIPDQDGNTSAFTPLNEEESLLSQQSATSIKSLFNFSSADSDISNIKNKSMIHLRGKLPSLTKKRSGFFCLNKLQNESSSNLEESKFNCSCQLEEIENQLQKEIEAREILDKSSQELSHKQLNIIHNLKKDISFWQNKCLDIKLDREKQRIKFQNEKKKIKKQQAAKINSVQEQLSKALDEIDRNHVKKERLIDLESKLRENKEREARNEEKIRELSAENKKLTQELMDLEKPEKLLEKAILFDYRNLSWITFQLYMHTYKIFINYFGSVGKNPHYAPPIPETGPQSAYQDNEGEHQNEEEEEQEEEEEEHDENEHEKDIYAEENEREEEQMEGSMFCQDNINPNPNVIANEGIHYQQMDSFGYAMMGYHQQQMMNMTSNPMSPNMNIPMPVQHIPYMGGSHSMSNSVIMNPMQMGYAQTPMAVYHQHNLTHPNPYTPFPPPYQNQPPSQTQNKNESYDQEDED